MNILDKLKFGLNAPKDTPLSRENSFDFIRAIAASLVVFSHSFALTGNTEPAIGGMSLGGLGVWIFFILSGYLIAASWDQYPRFNVFFAKRALRIFPGLIVVIILTIIACGVIASSLPLLTYFTHPATISYLNNILLYNGQIALPGVFENNPYPHAVNGSLWTLAYEFTMYIAVALIGVFNIFKKISPFKLWVLLCIVELLILIVGSDKFSVSIFYLSFDQFILLALLFFTGVLAYKERSKITLNYTAGFSTLILFIIFSILFSQFSALFAATLLAYSLFSLGRSGLFSKAGRYGDFSYGIYIYSFPVQQIIASITMTPDAYKMFAVSLPISVLFAALSWHLVESKALNLKSKINVNRYPLGQTKSAW